MDSQPRNTKGSQSYRRLLGILAKRWWVIAVTFIAIVTGTSIYLARTPRQYEARASIVIDSATPQVLGGQFRDVIDVEMGSWWSAREYIQTQYNVIRSEALADEVARRLERSGQLAKLGVGTGEAGQKAAAQLVLDSVQVDPLKESRVVNIVIRATNPEVATLLANSTAETYIDQNLERRLSRTRGAATWLGDQLLDLKRQLETSEMALYEFKHQNNILSVSLEDSRNILSHDVQRLSDALSEAKAKRIQLAARRKVLGAMRTGDPLNEPDPDLRENPVLQKLKESYVDQTAKLLEYRGKYGDKYPLLVSQEARLEATKNELRHEAELSLKALQAQFDLSVETERSLGAELESTKQAALALNKKQIDYDRLKRSADSNAKLYDLVLGRLKESDLAGKLGENNVRMLDRARLPSAPASPNVPEALGLAVLLGLAFGVGLAFGFDYLDNTVKSQEDIEVAAGVPFLGLIPKISLEDGQSADNVPLHIVEHSKSTVAECCRAIRTNLLFMSPDRPLCSFLITSSGPQEGKSTTSINLGVTMAQSGSRVLLVDTDLRRPRLHRAFGVSAERGMSTLILGESNIDDVVKATQVPNLWVIPSGPLPPNPAELLHAARFREVMAELRKRYDRIIFDSPPLGAVTDAAVLSTTVDGVVLVAKSARTTRDMLGRTTRQLADVKAKILGCVLNDVDLSRREYGYNYYYYYYHRYGYYYAEQEKPDQGAT